MKILVTGKGGQVGRALCALLGPQARAVDRTQLDLSRPEELPGKLESLWASEPFGAVINAAAYTQVDLAEKEEELAHRVNAESPGILARFSASRGIPFIHYSTDYVFNGEGNSPWKVEDPTSPLNAYGRGKLEGEKKIAQAGGKWLIFRTSWVYDAEGKNFLRTMLKLAQERETLRIVSDQMGAPTYAPHLAQATLVALRNAQETAPFPSGVYHLCSGGTTSWHGFAQAIFEEARKNGFSLKVGEVLAIRSEDFPTPARRPRNSRMDTSKARNVLGAQLPDWEEGMRECLREVKK